MDMGVWRGTAATAAVTLGLAGVLGFGSATAQASSAPQTAAVTAASGAGPCYDGTCRKRVSESRSIRVDSSRFGFRRVHITSITRTSVTVEAGTANSWLRSTVGEGGTAGLNNLRIRVASINNGKATLVFSRAG